MQDFPHDCGTVDTYALYGDDGDLCFSHPVWKNAFPHIVQLETVHRHKEVALAQVCILSTTLYDSLTYYMYPNMTKLN